MDINAPGTTYSHVILISSFSFVSKMVFKKGEGLPIAGKVSGHVNERADVLSIRTSVRIMLNNNVFCIT